MSDERRDDEGLGRALGRAIESQPVRETPYTASRLAQRIERPSGRGWTYALPIAAALAIFVAMGAFFVSRGTQGGVAGPDASATPGTSAPAPTSSPGNPSGTPAATPTLTLARLYFARDGLPPVGVDRAIEVEPGIQAADIPADQRVGRLLAALGSKSAPAPAGTTDAFPRSDPAGYHGQRVTVTGDLASIDFEIRAPNGDWGVRGAAQTQALLQQIVYTATEVPGIRRVLLTQNGRPLALDQLVVDKPLAREDVFGYTPMTAADQRIESNGTPVPADLTSKIDYVQTGGPGQPVRLVIDLAPRPPFPGGAWMPAFVASGQATTGASTAKYEIVLTIAGGTEKSLRDQTVDVTPLRYVRVSSGNEGTTYRLGVDDARPWRVSLTAGFTSGAMRLYVDMGGYPQLVNRNIAVYSPTAGESLTRSITLSGAARVFEANVSWRLRDGSGRAVANGFTTATQGTSPVWGLFQTAVAIPSGLAGSATLEVFWGSPRDGSDQDVVSIPITIR